MATRTARARIVPKKQPRKRFWAWIKSLFVLLFVCLTVGLAGGGVYFAERLSVAATMVPKLADVMVAGRKGPTRIMSADGKLIYESVSEFRDPIDLADVPEKVKYAILAAEDKRFYSHSGVDYWSMARQIVTNAKEQRIAGGASTITMQLAKLTFSNSERTFQRKIDDMALALQIERQLVKDQILELYMNQAYFGAGAYGIAAAAEVYFDKPLSKLTIAEAAMLARCVRRPSDENPRVNYERANQNKKVVLSEMLEAKWITREEFNQAVAEEPKLTKERELGKTIRSAPYFVRYILQEMRTMPELKDQDLESGGFTIVTTLDTRLQNYADDRAESLVKQFRRNGVRTAASVVLDKEGKILSMTGGINFKERQFNAVSQGRRQPGSSFKPFIYTAGFAYGEFSGPDDTIRNDLLRYGSWSIGKKGAGSTSIRSAIAYSYNAAAVHAITRVRPGNAVRFANRVFGFELTDRDAVPTLALGAVAVSPLEMAEAYTVFQNYGARRVKPFGIVRVTGPDGQVVYSKGANDNVIELKNLPRGAFNDIDSCLRSVVTTGTARNFASSVRNARGKTGTTNDNRDAWFCGYTNDYVAIGWVAGEYKDKDGKIKYAAMSDFVMGGTVTVRLWRDLVRKAQDLHGEGNRSGLGLGEEETPEYFGEEAPEREGGRTGDTSPPPSDVAPRTIEESEPEGEPIPEDQPEQTPPAETSPPPSSQPETLPPPKNSNGPLPEGAGLPPPTLPPN